MASLTDETMLWVAQRMTSWAEIRELAKRLELEEYEVDKVLHDNKEDTNEAALTLLRTWRRRHVNRTQAYEELHAALRKCGMNNLAARLELLTTAKPHTSKELTRPDLTTKVKLGSKIPRMPELTASHILKLSERITSRQELLDVGINVLKLHQHVVDRALNNYKTDIQVAAHKVLKTWLKKQTNRREAYTTLYTALRECDMHFLAAGLKEWVEETDRLTLYSQSTLTSENLREEEEKLAKIAELISVEDLQSIAMSRLGFTYSQLENIKTDGQHSEAINRAILVKWRNKSRENTIEKLVAILGTSGKVDMHKVREVLRDSAIGKAFEEVNTDGSKGVLTKSAIREAFEDACTDGSKEVNRGRFNIIGFYEAGKTSFLETLLGKDFDGQYVSTQGIAVQVVKVKSGVWNEAILNSSTLEEDFNEVVLAIHRDKMEDRASRDNHIPQENEEVKTKENQRQDENIPVTDMLSPEQEEKEIPTAHSKPKMSEAAYEQLLAQKQKHQNKELVELLAQKQKIQNKELLELLAQKQIKQNRELVELLAQKQNKEQVELLAQKQTKQNKELLELLAQKQKKQNKELLELLAQKQNKELVEEEEDDYLISAWDFGGQTAYYATHHLFLEAEATNLIVMDITKEFKSPLNPDDEPDANSSIPSTPAEFLCYWLNTIHSMTMLAAQNEEIQPNVAIVLTHKDVIEADEKIEDKQKYIEDYIDNICKHIKKKSYSSYISRNNIYVVSNKQGNEPEFKSVRQSIFQMVTRQKTWGMKRPLRWIKLEADIRKEAEKESIRHMDLTLVKELASQYGIVDKEVEMFLKFHHTTGDLVYFSDEGLRELVIIDPQWLVDMFQTFITPHEFIDRRDLSGEIKAELKAAVVSESSLHVLWAKEDVQFLLKLMIKFELIIPLSSRNDAQEMQYLIPCMLPTEGKFHNSNLEIHGDDEDKLTTTFDVSHTPKAGDSLPLGIFPRLLTRCSGMKNWKLGGISATEASFQIEHNAILHLTLVDNFTVHAKIACGKKVIGFDLKDLLDTRTTHDTNMVDFHFQSTDSFFILCPNCSPGDTEAHILKLKEKARNAKRQVFQIVQECPIHHTKRKKGQLIWLEQLETEETFSSIGKEEPSEPKSDGTLSELAIDSLRREVQIVELLEGEARTVKAAKSDVTLHVPSCIYGFLLGRIRTNFSRFLHLIPQTECILSPMCEYSLYPLVEIPAVLKAEKARYRIQIPHVGENREKQMIVRFGNIHNGHFRKCRLNAPSQNQDVYYTVDAKYVNVYTSHFSAGLVTAEGIDCCCGSANCYAYGALQNPSRKRPRVRLKVVLSSVLHNIEDFELKKIENPMCKLGLERLEKIEMQLSTESYDSLKSSVRVEIKDYDISKWKALKGCIVEMKLKSALKLVGQHICRSEPTEVAYFDLLCAQSSAENFFGMIAVDVNVVKQLKEADPGELQVNGAASTGHRESVATVAGNTESIHSATYPIVADLCCSTYNGQTQATQEAKLAKIAELVTASNLESIAITQLGFSDVELKHIANNYPKDSVKRNREVLIQWKDKSPNNTVDRLVAILAISGKVNMHEVRKVL